MHATHRIIRRGGGQIEKGSATASMARSPGPGARAMLGADWLKPPASRFPRPPVHWMRLDPSTSHQSDLGR